LGSIIRTSNNDPWHESAGPLDFQLCPTLSQISNNLDTSTHLSTIAMTFSSRIADVPDEHVAVTCDDVTISYGAFEAVKNVFLEVPRGKVTAFIGPSGCGKSTVLRCFNRMNDLIPSFSLKGRIIYEGQDLYGQSVDPVEVRRRIGMVFQRPNPFPKSIYENIAFGAKINGYTGDMDELVERSLRRAAVWDECKDKLQESGYSLSGGQQQRLCIARTIATQPDVILMDEPCSALDPISTLKVEETMHELKKEFTIVIVTHNMQQAVRVSDMTAFYNAVAVEGGSGKVGYLVEFDETQNIFNNPSQQATQEYVSGRFG
jgi:phosphate transport system ATP-binding protein